MTAKEIDNSVELLFTDDAYGTLYEQEVKIPQCDLFTAAYKINIVQVGNDAM